MATSDQSNSDSSDASVSKVLEDMTKPELAAAFGVSENQTKTEMIAEIKNLPIDVVDPNSGQQLADTTDPAVQRAMQYRGHSV